MAPPQLSAAPPPGPTIPTSRSQSSTPVSACANDSSGQVRTDEQLASTSIQSPDSSAQNPTSTSSIASGKPSNVAAIPWPYLILQQQAAALPITRPPKKNRSSGNASSGSRIIPTVYVNELHEAWNARPGSIPSKGSIAAWAHARNVNQGRVIGWFRWKRTHAQKLGQAVANENDEGYDLTLVTPPPPPNAQAVASASLYDPSLLTFDDSLHPDAMEIEPELHQDIQPGPSPKPAVFSHASSYLPSVSDPAHQHVAHTLDPPTHASGSSKPGEITLSHLSPQSSTILNIIKQQSGAPGVLRGSRKMPTTVISGRKSVYHVLRESGILERTSVGYVAKGVTYLSAIEALSKWIQDMQAKAPDVEPFRDLLRLRSCSINDVGKYFDTSMGSIWTRPGSSSANQKGKRKVEDGDLPLSIDTFQIPMDLRILGEILDEDPSTQMRKKRRMHSASDINFNGNVPAVQLPADTLSAPTVTSSPHFSAVDLGSLPLSAQTSLASLTPTSSSATLLASQPSHPLLKDLSSALLNEPLTPQPSASSLHPMSSRSISALLNPAPESPLAPPPHVALQPLITPPTPLPDPIPAPVNSTGIQYISISPSMTRRGAGITKSGKPRKSAAAKHAAQSVPEQGDDPPHHAAGSSTSGVNGGVPQPATASTNGPPAATGGPQAGPSRKFSSLSKLNKRELNAIWKARPGETPSLSSMAAWADNRNVDVTRVKRWFGLKKNWVVRGGGKVYDGDYELSPEAIKPSVEAAPPAEPAPQQSNGVVPAPPAPVEEQEIDELEDDDNEDDIYGLSAPLNITGVFKPKANMEIFKLQNRELQSPVASTLPNPLNPRPPLPSSSTTTLVASSDVSSKATSELSLDQVMV